MPKGDAVAIQRGRRESEAVSAYIQAIDSGGYSKSRGPSLDARLQKLNDKLEAPGLTVAQRVILIQRRMDILMAMDAGPALDMPALEQGFVEVVQSFSERHGITYATWRAVGVPARVLREAGYSEAGRGNRKKDEASSPAEAPTVPQKARKRADSSKAAQTRTSPPEMATGVA